jgi:hypothetical protein
MWRGVARGFGRDGFDVVGLSLILVGVAMLWRLRWFIVGAVMPAGAITLAWWISRTYRAGVDRHQAERDQLAARADRQHGWTVAGDERGTYGQYPPAI